MDEHQYGYRTGQTQPKKNRRDIVAMLLILAIFFCGIFSALHIMNIRLSVLQHKNDPPRVPLSFSRTEEDGAEGFYDEAAQSVALAGMLCQELSKPCQKLYNLPAGVYVAQVEQSSPAAGLGIAPGDVLTCFAGTKVTAPDTLRQLLAGRDPTAPVEVILYRDGQYKTLTLILDTQ